MATPADLLTERQRQGYDDEKHYRRASFAQEAKRLGGEVLPECDGGSGQNGGKGWRQRECDGAGMLRRWLGSVLLSAPRI